MGVPQPVLRALRFLHLVPNDVVAQYPAVALERQRHHPWKPRQALVHVFVAHVQPHGAVVCQDAPYFREHAAGVRRILRASVRFRPKTVPVRAPRRTRVASSTAGW